MFLPFEYFPYKPRFRQREVIQYIYQQASNGGHVLFNAPTGYGKTPVVLAALLPLAKELGVPILWVVRTGNETDRPIEELGRIVSNKNRRIFGLSIRGKRDMCLLARDMRISDHEGVSVLCKRMRNKCPYYRTLFYKEFKLGKPLLFSDILSIGVENSVCPYFLQLRLARSATIISMSYNYIFYEPISWGIRSYVNTEEALLVVDEAHNLQNVIANINSDRITLGTVERAIREVDRFKGEKVEVFLEKLKKLYKLLKEEADKLIGEDDRFDPIEIIEQSNITKEDFKLASKIVSRIYSDMLKENKSPRSSLRHLTDFLLAAIEMRNIEGIVFLKYKERDRVIFERWDMRAAEYLKDIWDRFYSIIFMSGTLRPANAFADIIGLQRYSVVSDSFTISKNNVLAIITKDLTTKGEELEEDMRKRYSDSLKKILPSIRVNTAIFFASYRIMNKLIKDIKTVSENEGRELFIEDEYTRGEEARRILEEFKRSKNAVLCASMQGRFAEGADFPGEALEAVILVGMPFERPTLKTNLYISYYEKIYGKEKGRFYAYILPALRRAAQSMGRAIRSENDRAILIAMDERYKEQKYLSLLPDFFKENAKTANIPAAVELIEEFLA